MALKFKPALDLSASAAALPVRIAGKTPERRFFTLNEFRSEAGAEGKRFFTGYAACFNVLSAMLGGKQFRFRERIKPGAFTRALRDKQDVLHLINHDPSLLLGRTNAGTTELFEDSKGLGFRTLIANRSYELDLIQSMERGEVNECSFSFIVNGEAGQSWEEDPQDRNAEIRNLLDVDLIDVSIVNGPAYSGTSAQIDHSLRSRVFFPEGLPTMLEARSKAAAEPAPEPNPGATPKNDEDAGVCECECQQCMNGNCGECSDPDCDDPLCMCNRSLRKGQHRIVHLAKEIRAGVMPSFCRSIRNQADPTVLELYFYGDIGESWWGDSITASSVRAQLEQGGEYSKILARINSFGGDAFEGVAIFNLLRAQKKPVETCIDGLAASAASVIAMAGDVRTMGTNTLLMIHNAMAAVYGYASDMRSVAEVLDTISGAIANTYVDKTGKAKDYIQGLMDAETWMDAEACVKDGFATRVAEADEPAEEARVLIRPIFETALLRYPNMPEAFRSRLAAIIAAKEDEEDRERMRLRARVSATI